MYKDLNEAREYYATLRELVMQLSGGREDADALAKVEGLCGAATAALDDAECHERLRAVRTQAGELFSREGPLKCACSSSRPCVTASQSSSQPRISRQRSNTSKWPPLGSRVN